MIILTILLCLCLMTGGTFALFTDKDTTNIAISSGKVEVVATMGSLELYSPTLIGADGAIVDDTNKAIDNKTFANGGTAKIDGDTLKLENMTAGDKATFAISIENKSNIAIQWQTAFEVNKDTGLFAGLNITVDSKSFSGANETDWTLIPANTAIKDVTLVVELPTTAVEAYMDKSCEISFAINAIQGNASAYNTVKVASLEEMKNAIANAEEPTMLLLADGTYGGTDNKIFFEEIGGFSNKDIVFSGNKNVVIDASNQQGVNDVPDLTDSTITFDGVTVKWSTANEGYQGVKNPQKVVYKNCNISGTQFMYSSADFINCTFTTEDSYAVYTRASGNYTFTDCEFITGGRAIMMYSDAGISVNVTLNNCTFSDDGTYTSKDKAVVETGDYGSACVYSIKIIKCTITKGFEANNSTSPLWGNKDNMPTDRLNVIIDDKDVY